MNQTTITLPLWFKKISDEEDDGDVLTVSTSSSVDAWVLDSGAS